MIVVRTIVLIAFLLFILSCDLRENQKLKKQVGELLEQLELQMEANQKLLDRIKQLEEVEGGKDLEKDSKNLKIDLNRKSIV